MKPKAIIYTSNTGFTAEYAEMFGKETGLPVCALEKAEQRKIPVIYFGWIMAGNIKGYKKAAKRFDICAVCGVGAYETGSQIDVLKKTNKLPENLPVFTLQGGMDISKLKGMNKLLIRLMVKNLSKNQKSSGGDTDLLDMLTNGGNRVRHGNLKKPLEWYGSER